MIKWFVVSNQPFTEIESEELIAVMTYLRPSLEKHLIKADALKARIMKAAEEQREKLKKYIKVGPFSLPYSRGMTG